MNLNADLSVLAFGPAANVDHLLFDLVNLQEYALSVLKAFSSQGITENISKNM